MPQKKATPKTKLITVEVVHASGQVFRWEVERAMVTLPDRYTSETTLEVWGEKDNGNWAIALPVGASVQVSS